eukprot:scaffold176200_cov16-Tisochrysis_lutea.AAC.3
MGKKGHLARQRKKNVCLLAMTGQDSGISAGRAVLLLLLTLLCLWRMRHRAETVQMAMRKGQNT